MSSEIPAYVQDIRWFHGEINRRGLPKPNEGAGSAFAERVAILVEDDSSSERVRSARVWALGDYLAGIGMPRIEVN